MAEAVYVSFDKMRAEFARVLRKSGFDGESLNQCAQVLAENSLDGIYTHGVNRFARFVKLVYEGFIHANAGPTICTSSGCNRAMGWALGAGPTNALFATQRALSLSKRHGVGCVGLSNTNHWMRGGSYSWKAAQEGFLFLGWTNTTANMPAWGAVDRRLGNNPLVIRLGYTDINHNDCLNGRWNSIEADYNKQGIKEQVSSDNLRELKLFYESGENVLWITFYANTMWWCFVESKVRQLQDSTKIRSVRGRWTDTNIRGERLSFGQLRGNLLKTQVYRRSICDIDGEDYAAAKINGEKNTEVLRAESSLAELKGAIAILIQTLHWRDFEIFVDLVFRQGGWQRISELGKTQKTLDLDLYSPVLNERCMVQIRSESDSDEFDAYLSDFQNMRGYSRFLYVVHTPAQSLRMRESARTVKLLFANQLSELAISAGLTNWIMSKVS